MDGVDGRGGAAAPYSAAAVEGVLGLVGRILSDGEAKYRRLNTASKHFARYAEVLPLLEAAGFRRRDGGYLVNDADAGALAAATDMLRGLVEAARTEAARTESARNDAARNDADSAIEDPADAQYREDTPRDLAPAAARCEDAPQDVPDEARREDEDLNWADLPQDLLRFQISTLLLDAQRAGAGTRALLCADSTCKRWRFALAPLWGRTRADVCKRVGARARLEVEWKRFVRFQDRGFARGLAPPASARGVSRFNAKLEARGLRLPLEFEVSVACFHDGQHCGAFYDGARLLALADVMKEAEWVEPPLLPVGARVAGRQLCVCSDTGRVLLLRGAAATLCVAQSWTAFLRLV
ncbi:hypothetical protein M885DRAFT_524868 [Pelagophyceae sp. CCMP2097]|nr:hypothetical protein M885DRAFT_524868 [Pelagophyceae sp. CCMP2097]